MILPMGKDFVASITFSGEITQKRLAKLVSCVQLAMDEYPEDVTVQGDEVAEEGDPEDQEGP